MKNGPSVSKGGLHGIPFMQCILPQVSESVPHSLMRDTALTASNLIPIHGSADYTVQFLETLGKISKQWVHFQGAYVKSKLKDTCYTMIPGAKVSKKQTAFHILLDSEEKRIFNGWWNLQKPEKINFLLHLVLGAGPRGLKSNFQEPC